MALPTYRFPRGGLPLCLEMYRAGARAFFFLGVTGSEGGGSSGVGAGSAAGAFFDSTCAKSAARGPGRFFSGTSALRYGCSL